MVVTLDITNDAELRAAVKDMIAGQVKSILRTDLEAMMLDELSRKIKGTEKSNFERMMKEAMSKAIASILYKEHGVDDWKDAYIGPYIESYLSRKLNEKKWADMADRLASEKVSKILAGLTK